MVDNARGGFPLEMARLAHHPELSQIDAMAEDVIESVKTYVREKPASALLWAVGIGFVLGWRLKPW